MSWQGRVFFSFSFPFRWMDGWPRWEGGLGEVGDIVIVQTDVLIFRCANWRWGDWNGWRGTSAGFLLSFVFHKYSSSGAALHFLIWEAWLYICFSRYLFELWGQSRGYSYC